MQEARKDAKSVAARLALAKPRSILSLAAPPLDRLARRQVHPTDARDHRRHRRLAAGPPRRHVFSRSSQTDSCHVSQPHRRHPRQPCVLPVMIYRGHHPYRRHPVEPLRRAAAACRRRRHACRQRRRCCCLTARPCRRGEESFRFRVATCEWKHGGEGTNSLPLPCQLNAPTQWLTPAHRVYYLVLHRKALPPCSCTQTLHTGAVHRGPPGFCAASRACPGPPPSSWLPWQAAPFVHTRTHLEGRPPAAAPPVPSRPAPPEAAPPPSRWPGPPAAG